MADARNIGVDYNFDDNRILNANLNTDDIQFIFADIAATAGQEYHLVSKARYAFAIQEVTLICDTGTISSSVSIAGIDVPGLQDMEAYNELTDFTPTALYYVVAGDLVVLTITALTGTPLQLTGNVKIKRS